MGVIARQGFKYSVVNTVGLLIGVASTLLLYSKKEVADLYGLMRFLLDTGLFWYPFLSLGVSNITMRFFAKFEDKKSGHHGYLALLLVWLLVGFSLFALVGLLTWTITQSFFENRDLILRSNLWAILPIAGLQTLNIVLYHYIAGFKRIVVPSILIDFLPKLAIPLLVLLFYFDKISTNGVVWGMIFYLMAITFGLLIYIKSLGQLHLKLDRAFITPSLKKEMLGFAGFGIVAGILMMLITKLDTILVPTLLGAGKNTVYAIASFFAGILDVPIKAIMAISVPMLAKYFHENNHAEIDSLYKKSSINLLIAGIGVFGLVWLSLFDVFALMQNTEAMSGAYWVVLWLGLAKLVEMVTSLNNNILSYSKHYHYYLLALALLGVLTIALNYILIPKYGLTGVAMSVFFSSLSFNLVNLYLVWKKYGFQPFSNKIPIVLLIGLCSYLIVKFAPVHFENPILSIGFKSTVYLALYVFGILYFKTSIDFEQFAKATVSNFKKLTKK